MDPVNNTHVTPQIRYISHRHWLTTKDVRMNFLQGEQLIVDSTETGKAKGTALFEMITGPTTSKCHGKQSGDSLLLINSNGIRDGDDGVGNGKGNGRHTTATRKESSAKTETMDIEVCQTRSSLIGRCLLIITFKVLKYDENSYIS